jgi:hypothetical protein
MYQTNCSYHPVVHLRSTSHMIHDVQLEPAGHHPASCVRALRIIIARHLTFRSPTRGCASYTIDARSVDFYSSYSQFDRPSMF